MTGINNDQESQLTSEVWEPFGTLIDAMKSVSNGLPTFMSALKTGEIRARATSPLPVTGIPILDRADPSSINWWQLYESVEIGHSDAEQKWINWLRDDVEVQQAPTLRIYTKLANAKRVFWSDIQSLGWFASEDAWFVAQIGNQKTRSRALRYLRVHVAMEHCGCEARDQIGKTAIPGGCNCVEAACDYLVASIREKKLRASLLSADGSSRLVLPVELMTAPFNATAGTFQLLDAPGDLLFEPSEVQSAAAARSAADGSALITRAPAVKKRRPPSDDAILAKAHEMWARGIRDKRIIAKEMRHEPGFRDVATTRVRELIKGRYEGGLPPMVTGTG